MALFYWCLEKSRLYTFAKLQFSHDKFLCLSDFFILNMKIDCRTMFERAVFVK